MLNHRLHCTDLKPVSNMPSICPSEFYPLVLKPVLNTFKGNLLNSGTSSPLPGPHPGLLPLHFPQPDSIHSHKCIAIVVIFPVYGFNGFATVDAQHISKHQVCLKLNIFIKIIKVNDYPWSMIWQYICSFSSWDGKILTLAYCDTVGEKKYSPINHS